MITTIVAGFLALYYIDTIRVAMWAKNQEI